MKRAKFLVALMTIASLVLGTFSVAYAADYEDLSVSDKAYYGDSNLFVGNYPVVADMADLNKDIENNLFKTYAETGRVGFSFEPTDVNDNIALGNTFDVSYTVENNNRYAVIAVTYSVPTPVGSIKPADVVKNWYVDKEGMVAISEEDYKAGIEAQDAEEAAEEETAEEEEVEEEAVVEEEPAEAIMAPIRDCIEPLGFKLAWDAETKSVTVSKGDFSTVITVDENVYVVDGETVELESAPLFQDGKVYVPISFFALVLGADVEVDDNGKVTVSAPVAADAEEETETEEVAADSDEEVAETEEVAADSDEEVETEEE